MWISPQRSGFVLASGALRDGRGNRHQWVAGAVARRMQGSKIGRDSKWTVPGALPGSVADHLTKCALVGGGSIV
jgi:hypothetical protein